MQYQVPQFIEVEDKIFGPLTFRQFAYLAGGAGATLLFFTLLPWWIAIFLSMPFVALALALSFYQINGQPFVNALEHGISYFLNNKLYLWKQRPPQAPQQTVTAPTAQSAIPVVPKMTESKLKDLAWSLNIKDTSAQGGSNMNA